MNIILLVILGPLPLNPFICFPSLYILPESKNLPESLALHGHVDISSTEIAKLIGCVLKGVRRRLCVWA